MIKFEYTTISCEVKGYYIMKKFFALLFLIVLICFGVLSCAKDESSNPVKPVNETENKYQSEVFPDDEELENMYKSIETEIAPYISRISNLKINGKKSDFSADSEALKKGIESLIAQQESFNKKYDEDKYIVLLGVYNKMCENGRLVIEDITAANGNPDKFSMKNLDNFSVNYYDYKSVFKGNTEQ